jgi:putative ATP-dependent endonuclease of OLD family
VHRLSHVIINNFRACRNVSFPIDAFTPLVGQNNVGKSTILEALKWVLKPSALSQGDFADNIRCRNLAFKWCSLHTRQ